MRQQGAALILVLWVISLLTIMAGSFVLTVRRETSVISYRRDSAQAVALAEAGVVMAQKMLLEQDANKRWRGDGSLYQLDFAEAKVRVKVFSEAGKISLNHVTETFLTSVLQASPVTPEQLPVLVDSILDWRDEDDLVRLNGGEESAYASAGYQPRNGAFASLAELQMVQAMTPAIYTWMEDFFSINAQAEINAKLASAEVLHFLYPGQAEAINTYLMDRFMAAQQGVEAPELALSTDVKHSAQGSNFYTVISEAQINDKVTTRLRVLLEKQEMMGPEQPFIISRWQTDYQMNKSLFDETENEWVVKRYQEAE